MWSSFLAPGRNCASHGNATPLKWSQCNLWKDIICCTTESSKAATPPWEPATSPTNSIQRCMRNPATELRKCVFLSRAVEDIFVTLLSPFKGVRVHAAFLQPFWGEAAMLHPGRVSRRALMQTWCFLAQPGPNCQSSFPSADSWLKCVANLDLLSSEKAVQTMINVYNSDSNKNVSYGETQNSLSFL